MKKAICDALLPFINNGMLSMDKLTELIYIKEFIDRVSANSYISEETALNLEKKFGSKPGVITWGDYFQAEIATTLSSLNIAEFRKSIDTVRFDIISSYMIFSDKENDFFEWIDNNFSDINPDQKEKYTEDELDIIHLHILKNYYIDLAIQNNFTRDEIKWHSRYEEAKAI